MAQMFSFRSLCVMALLALAACESAPPARALRPVPVLGSDVSSCSELRAEGPQPLDGDPQPDPSRLGGWIVIAFSLTGDGKPSDLKIVDFEPKDDKAFVQWAVDRLKRTRFRPGAVRDHCVSVGSFYRH